jgi:XTP/dITP diphosphohydrolase
LESLLVASTNAGKLAELREMITNFHWLALSDVGLAGMDVEETETTFLGNALLKANAYSKASGLPTLADDSGLCVDALEGAPGVYSARYAPTSPERIAKLLDALKDVPAERRTAHFTCVLALVILDRVTLFAEGHVYGHIAMAPRGVNGFGYDPVFLLDDGRTMAELDSAEKNRISHRGVALQRFAPILSLLKSL